MLICLKNRKKCKNQYKKQKIAYYQWLHSNCYNTKVWTLSIRLSEISGVVNQQFQFSKLNNVVSWRNLVYAGGNSCWIMEKNYKESHEEGILKTFNGTPVE